MTPNLARKRADEKNGPKSHKYFSGHLRIPHSRRSHQGPSGGGGAVRPPVAVEPSLGVLVAGVELFGSAP